MNCTTGKCHVANGGFCATSVPLSPPCSTSAIAAIEVLTSVHNSPQTGEMLVVAGFPACLPDQRAGWKACYHRELSQVSEICTDVSRGMIDISSKIRVQSDA